MSEQPPALTMIPASEAFRRAARGRVASLWPSRTGDGRLDPPCPIVAPKFTLQATDRVFTIGSCFARNIEEYLDVLGFELPTLAFQATTEEWHGRPSGMLNKYTPASIWQEIDRAVRARAARSEDERLQIIREPIAVLANGQAIDLELLGYAPVSLERAQQRRESVDAIYQRLFECEAVVITPGLIESWFDKKTSLFILQGPPPRLMKKHPERFGFAVLSYGECMWYMERSIDLIMRTGRADKKILLTTSPVPLSRTFTGQDVLVANSYGKSILRSICGDIIAKFPMVDYFPSYEMVTLNRSWGAWERDRIHVSDRLVANIAGHMVENYTPNGPNVSPELERAVAARWRALMARRVRKRTQKLLQASTRLWSHSIMRLSAASLSSKLKRAEPDFGSRP